jgi:regulator of nonsense transcripts 1
LVHYKEKDCLVDGALNNLKVSMIQFNRPRKQYRKDDKFRQGLAHQIDAREAFARPPLAADSKCNNVSILSATNSVNNVYFMADRRNQKGYGSEFLKTHDPIGYIPSDMGSLPSSQFSIPLIPAASGPFTQDLSQTSVSNRRNARQYAINGNSNAGDSSAFANHSLSQSQSSVMGSQNMYSSQSSIGLALSQSDRLRMMAEMASQNANGGHGSLMSQESMGFTYDDYKSEDTQSMLSQDFDLRSQASQSFTQY